MVVAADDGHVLREAGIVPQILRQENAALRVRLAARGEGKERAHPALLYERHRVHLIGKALPALGAVRRKAAIHRERHIENAAELVPQARGHRKTPLGIERVHIFAGHTRRLPSLFACGQS